MFIGENKKYDIGADVLVYWEDEGMIYTMGTILHKYWGYRNWMYVIEMEDCEIEKVFDFQIIGEVYY